MSFCNNFNVLHCSFHHFVCKHRRNINLQNRGEKHWKTITTIYLWDLKTIIKLFKHVCLWSSAIMPGSPLSIKLTFESLNFISLLCLCCLDQLQTRWQLTEMTIITVKCETKQNVLSWWNNLHLTWKNQWKNLYSEKMCYTLRGKICRAAKMSPLIDLFIQEKKKKESACIYGVFRAKIPNNWPGSSYSNLKISCSCLWCFIVNRKLSCGLLIKQNE